MTTYSTKMDKKNTTIAGTANSVEDEPQSVQDAAVKRETTTDKSQQKVGFGLVVEDDETSIISFASEEDLEDPQAVVVAVNSKTKPTKCYTLFGFVCDCALYLLIAGSTALSLAAFMFWWWWAMQKQT